MSLRKGKINIGEYILAASTPNFLVAEMFSIGYLESVSIDKDKSSRKIKTIRLKENPQLVHKHMMRITPQEGEYIIKFWKMMSPNQSLSGLLRKIRKEGFSEAELEELDRQS